jgi:nucleotide-binding universal stress UspA family protein
MPLRFRRILVPHDFSDHATRALRTALDLARQSAGRVTVLHVVTPVYPMAAVPAAWMPPPDLVPTARQELERLVKRAAGRADAPPVACRVEVGDPAERIVALAARADLVVMATRGRSGLAHLLIGSVAEKVVRHAPAPVLTMHAGTARGRRRR